MALMTVAIYTIRADLLIPIGHQRTLTIKDVGC